MGVTLYRGCSSRELRYIGVVPVGIMLYRGGGCSNGGYVMSGLFQWELCFNWVPS